jgi:hypothetical protein
MGVVDEELKRLDGETAIETEVRRVLACMVRSALFGIQVERRTFDDWTEVPVFGEKWTMWYRGETLGQDDFDVVPWLLHCRRTTPLIRSTRYRILKQLGRARCLNSYTWLDGVLTRLSHAGVRISDGCRTIEMPTIVDWTSTSSMPNRRRRRECSVLASSLQLQF